MNLLERLTFTKKQLPEFITGKRKECYKIEGNYDFSLKVNINTETLY